jgi:hypothetical protein
MAENKFIDCFLNKLMGKGRNALGVGRLFNAFLRIFIEKMEN